MVQRKYEPMLLSPVRELPVGPEWVYEAKLDGYRMMAQIALGQTVFITRPGNDFTDRYPAAAAQLPTALQGHDAVLDGEMVGLDAQGRERRAELARTHPNAVYYIFDLLELDGESLIRRPLRERRRQLDEIFVAQPRIKLSTLFYDPAPLVVAAHAQGFEGVVAKRLDSRYLPGRRSKRWLKHRFATRTTS